MYVSNARVYAVGEYDLIKRSAYKIDKKILKPKLTIENVLHFLLELLLRYKAYTIIALFRQIIWVFL